MFNRQKNFSYVKKLAILLVLSSQVAGNLLLIPAADTRVLIAQIRDLGIEVPKEEQADNLRKAGIEYLKAKRFAQAEDSLKRAWRIYRNLGDERNIGIILNDLGLVYSYQKEYRRAAAVYRQAFTALEKVEYLEGQWATLYHFGALSYQQGLSYPDQSREQQISFRRALNLYDRAFNLLEDFNICFIDKQKLENMESLTLEAREKVSQRLGRFSISTKLELEQIKLLSEEEKINKQIDDITTEECPPINSTGQSTVLVDDGGLFD